MDVVDLAHLMEGLATIEPAGGFGSVTISAHRTEGEIAIMIEGGGGIERAAIDAAEAAVAERTPRRGNGHGDTTAKAPNVRIRTPRAPTALRARDERWAGRRSEDIAADLRGNGRGDAGATPWERARDYAVTVETGGGQVLAERRRWADNARAAALGVDPERIEAARAALRSPDAHVRGPVVVHARRMAAPEERYWRVYPGDWS